MTDIRALPERIIARHLFFKIGLSENLTRVLRALPSEAPPPVSEACTEEYSNDN